jgi:hypothetical protein
MKRHALVIRTSLWIAALAIVVAAPVAQAQGTLFVEGGNVGIGVATPDQPLHVQSDDGSARVFVEDTSGNSGGTLFQIQSNGVTKFKITNTAAVEWNFQAGNSGFAISRSGTGGAEFLVRNGGEVEMGPGGNGVFNMDAAGNLSVTSLTETSSVHSKTGFEMLDRASVLDRVLGLDVREWSYRDDPREARHVGPTAEDFFAAFALGKDDKHIAPRDLAGVALVALQELHGQLERKDETISRLETLQREQAARNEDLERRLSELEERLASLSR